MNPQAAITLQPEYTRQLVHFLYQITPETLPAEVIDRARYFFLDYLAVAIRGSQEESAKCVQRIYNGLDLDKLNFLSPAERPPRIVGVGRLVEKKGFATLIEACAILKERGSRFECEIVGDGALKTTGSWRTRPRTLSRAACTGAS